MKLSLPIGKRWTLHAWVGWTLVRDKCWTCGMTNITQDGRYIPFFDYDVRDLKLVEGEMRRFQDRWEIGDTHIFDSGRGYHAVSFAKFSFQEYREMLEDSAVDDKFRGTRRKRTWTLRFAPRGKTRAPIWVKSLLATSKRERSRAHYLAYRALFPEVTERGTHLDEHGKVTIDRYQTIDKSTTGGA